MYQYVKTVKVVSGGVYKMLKITCVKLNPPAVKKWLGPVTIFSVDYVETF